MDSMQCPECGAFEVPIEASSCPECGYPILALSGFTIRKRLLDAGPEPNTNENEITPPKGKQLKEKFSRAKKALGKKSKQKLTLEEVLSPQRIQLAEDEKSIDPIPPDETDKTLVQPVNTQSQLDFQPSEEEITSTEKTEPVIVSAEPETIPEPEIEVAEAKMESPIEETAVTISSEKAESMIVPAEPAKLPEPEIEAAEAEPSVEGTADAITNEEIEPAMVPAEPVTIPEPEIEVAPVEETADTISNQPVMIPAEPVTIPEPEIQTAEASAIVEPEQEPAKEEVIIPEPIEVKPPKPKRHIVLSELEVEDLPPPPPLIAPDDHQYASRNYPKLGLQAVSNEVSDETCYECGKEVDPNANFCPHCHASLLRRYCPGCRRLVAGNTTYCAYCGAPASSIAEPPRNFATLLAILIIIFTGAAIFVAKDLPFVQSYVNKPIAKNTKVTAPPKVQQPSTAPPAKQSESPTPIAKETALPATPAVRPKQDGLVESNLPEVEASKQPATQQPTVQQQTETRPPSVVEAPQNSPPTPTKPSTTGFNSAPVSGIQTYKHRDPSLARYLNSVGFRLIQQRRYQEAVPILKRSVSYFPDNTKDIVYAYALFNLGHALRMSGRANEAIPVLEARLKIDNQRETVRKELAAARVAALGRQFQ